ncbi:MAG: hypothetical protein JWM12_1394 [Ilumatobacteraceae bacterium]|nr:hypothetical protein [Ilumatobacteraceae bacterium]
MHRAHDNAAGKSGAVSVTTQPRLRWRGSLLAVAVYLVAEIVLVGVTAWAVDRKVHALWVATSLVAGVGFWLASQQYRVWALTRDVRGLRWQLVLAMSGIVLIYAAAHLVRQASAENSQIWAAVAIGLLFVGFLPVMHIVRTDVNAAPPADDPRATSTTPASVQRPSFVRYLFAWLANAAVIGLAVVPGLMVLGAGWKPAVLVASAWFVSALVDRLGRLRHYWLAAVVFAAVAGVLLIVVLHTDLAGRSVDASVALVGLGLLGVLGLVDAISAWARNRESTASWASRRARAVPVLAVAAVLAVAGIVWTVDRLGGVPWPIQVLVIVACIAFGASFVSRGQGFVVVALLGALLVWTIADRTDRAPLDPSPNGVGTIVALGDSYIAGEGAHRFFPDTNVNGANDCRRSSSAFPYLVASRFDMHLVFDACSGALATQIWNDGQIKSDTDPGDPIGELPQLNNDLPPRPDLVLISIGGNDGLFGDIGRSCALPGSCSDNEALFDGNLHNVRSAVAKALVEVAEKFPESPIVVVPYPQMLIETGCATVPLDGREVSYLHGFVHRLDAAVQAAVTDANGNAPAGTAPHITFFADGEHAYAGNELCSGAQKEPPINAIRLAPTEAPSVFVRMIPTNWTHASFHPREFGHQLMADSLAGWLTGRFPGFGAPVATVTEPAPVEPVVGAPAPDPAPTCPDRKPCQDEVQEWMTRHALDSLRGLVVPALILLAAGWVAAAAARRYLVVGWSSGALTARIRRWLTRRSRNATPST